MERKKLPVGIENFEEIRREGFYYIDKTGLIRDLLNNWGKVNLFTRPRRFGKTLNMSMLKCFLEVGADKSLFDGLAITKENGAVRSVYGEISRGVYLAQGRGWADVRGCLWHAAAAHTFRSFADAGAARKRADRRGTTKSLWRES